MTDSWWDGGTVAGVTDTRLVGATPWISDDGSNSGVRITLEIDYRVDRTDPFTAR